MSIRMLLLAAVGLINVGTVGAQVAAPAPGTKYPAIRTQFNRSLSEAVTTEQMLTAFRQTVSQGRHAGRPLAWRMFGDFQPGFFLNPRIPGVATAVRVLASDNRNNVVGSQRTLRYAMSLAEDDRFRVLGLNRSRINALGTTDADIEFMHSATGRLGRMEVKNMTLASQRASLGKIKMQIAKMAEDARRTGEIQVWGNRHEVLPAVRVFAQRHGVVVEERLRTGSHGLRPGDVKFQQFTQRLDARFQAATTTSAVLSGGVGLGLGFHMLTESAQQLSRDLEVFGGDRADWLQIGEHGALTLARGSFMFSGALELTKDARGMANSAKVTSLSRWGARAGVIGTVTTEGFVVAQYFEGQLTERQFWRGQSNIGGGIAGGVVGAWAGAKAGGAIGGAVGSVFPGLGTVAGATVGAAIGGTVGGLGGGMVGAHYAGQGLDHLYAIQDRDQHERYVQYLSQLYQP